MAVAVVPASARADEPPAESTPTDAAAREKSRVAFRRGVAQLRTQDWAAARASFEEAWGLFQHPSILLNLGIARLRTNDPVAAEQDLVRFLSEDPGAAAEEVASARDALAEARAQIGGLRVVVTPVVARVTLDGKPVAVRTRGGTEGGVVESRLAAGKHALRVEADGFEPKTTPVDVPPKVDTEVRVALVEIGGRKRVGPPVHSPLRTIVGWSLAGASTLSFAASGFMGFRALSLADEYGDRSSSSYQSRDVKDEGLVFRTGTDIALITAVVTGGIAAVLLLTDLGVSSDEGVAAQRVAPRVGGRGGKRAIGSEPALLRW